MGAATGIAGSIIGGINSAKARKRQQAILDNQEKRATAQYNRDYYKDYTQTASAQAALKQARDIYNDGVSRAQATQAVMGGTDEAVAAEKARASEAIANTTSNIAANGEQQAQHAADRYNQQMDNIDSQRSNIEAQSAQQAAASGSAAMSAGMGLATADASANGNLVGNMFGFSEQKKKKQHGYEE